MCNPGKQDYLVHQKYQTTTDSKRSVAAQRCQKPTYWPLEAEYHYDQGKGQKHNPREARTPTGLQDQISSQPICKTSLHQIKVSREWMN